MKRLNAQKVKGKGGEEDGECNGRTALRDIRKQWDQIKQRQRNNKCNNSVTTTG